MGVREGFKMPFTSYPEAISAAILDLNESNGSEESSIMDTVRFNYKDLPSDFELKLTHHLKVMKSTGELVMVGERYKRPVSVTSSRGRGRPRKIKPISVEVKTPRSRGRPRKHTLESTPFLKESRPRGRPKKEVNPEEVKTPKSRGRPRKHALESGTPQQESRLRGRPKKSLKKDQEGNGDAPRSHSKLTKAELVNRIQRVLEVLQDNVKPGGGRPQKTVLASRASTTPSRDCA